MLSSALFLIASYGAAVAATIAGFGSSTLLIPVAFLFMDIKTAVFVVAVFHLFNNIFKIRLFWKSIDFKIFLLFGIPSILMAFSGAMLISVIPLDVVKIVLGVFLIVYTSHFLATAYKYKQQNECPLRALVKHKKKQFCYQRRIVWQRTTFSRQFGY